jgi:hypothetical protein
MNFIHFLTNLILTNEIEKENQSKKYIKRTMLTQVNFLNP